MSETDNRSNEPKPADILQDLTEITQEQFNALPLATIADMTTLLKARGAQIKALSGILTSRSLDRFRAEGLKKLGEKRFGSATIKNEDCKVKFEVPKEVDWDQDGLAKLAALMREDGEDPATYMTVKYSVSEATFACLPEDIEPIFARLRTESAGTPKVVVTKET